MPTLDDELSQRLKRAAVRVADASFEELVRLKERRELRNRVQTIASIVIVFVVIGGAWLALDRHSKSAPAGPANSPAAPVSNGDIVSVATGDLGKTWIQSYSPDLNSGLKLTKAGYYFSPAVDPTGHLVAFSSMSHANGSGGSAIDIVSMTGGSVQRLLDPTWFATDPAWSPDGKLIAFAGGGPSRADGIWSVAADGQSSPRLIYPVQTDVSVVGNPSWSPDGSRIVFDMANGALSTPPNFDLFVVSSDGKGSPTDLTPNTPMVSEVSPDWSPDGKLIAFSAQSLTASGPCHCLNSSIVFIAPDGSSQRTWGVSHTMESDPAWAPDGTQIVFADHEKPGPTVLYTVQVSSGQALVDAGAGSEPSWQPILSSGASATTSAGYATIPGVPDFVCNVSTMLANFASPDVPSVAYMFTKGRNGQCTSDYSGGSWYLALSRHGLGTFSDTYVFGPFACASPCSLLAAPDLDGDGRAELAILTLQSGTPQFRLFRVTNGGLPPVFEPIYADAQHKELFIFPWLHTNQIKTGVLCDRTNHLLHFILFDRQSGRWRNYSVAGALNGTMLATTPDNSSGLGLSPGFALNDRYMCGAPVKP